MAVVLGLLAAVAFAAGTVLQQRGTMTTSASDDDPRFLVQILREPVWLCGALLQGAGWVFQAAALDRGALVVVQSLTTLSLVLALPLGARFTGQQVGRTEVVGAIVIVVGIVVFLSVGAPGGGDATPAASAWWTAFALTIVLVCGAGLLGRARRDGAVKAALFGTGAGVAYAYQAAVTKEFVGELGNGIAALLATWSTYALIVSAVIGFALQQSALKTGSLAPAMGSSNASTLVFSVVFGIVVFDEAIVTHDDLRLPAWFGLAVAVVGVILLASRASAPAPTLSPADG